VFEILLVILLRVVSLEGVLLHSIERVDWEQELLSFERCEWESFGAVEVLLVILLRPVRLEGVDG
jgi:hypothetical protein